MAKGKAKDLGRAADEDDDRSNAKDNGRSRGGEEDDFTM
jgi:hypothetical protein